MITIPTLFILGAGASNPYGYPTARGLRRFIVEEFESYIGNYIFDDHPQENERKQLVTAKNARSLKNAFYLSSNPSIDIFLSRNKNFLDIGKKAIACGIFEFEKKNINHFRENTEEKYDWYTYLYHRMTEKLIAHEHYAGFKENEVNFITFNYDRSIEHFLFESFVCSFTEMPLADLSISDIFPFKFIHLYGQIERLPWQKFEETGIVFKTAGYTNGLKYGGEGKVNLERLASNVNIIYGNGENKNIAIAKGLIRRAKRIFFLGFGYALENLKVLDIPLIFENDQIIYGTALNSTKKQLNDIMTKLTPEKIKTKQGIESGDKWAKTMGSISIFIENRNCRESLEQYL